MHIQQMSDAELASYASFIRAQVDELAHRVRGNQQHPAWVDWTQACMIADEIQSCSGGGWIMKRRLITDEKFIIVRGSKKVLPAGT